MLPRKTTLTRFALDALYYSSAYRVFEPTWRGVGVIFTLHHVRPASAQTDFSPNRILDVSPQFLDRTIQQVKECGYDIITLSEARQRLIESDFRSQFVCFTLDDGYLDNYSIAQPIFAKHNAPFTVYITTGLPDGDAVLWWQHLEDILRDEQDFVLRTDDGELFFKTKTLQQKCRAFDTIYWKLRQLPHPQQHSVIQRFIEDYGVNSAELCRRSSMTWEMITNLSRSGLATIGAHTLNHYSLAKLSYDDVREEADKSRSIIAARTGSNPVHFAYPFGDPSSAAQREFDAMGELGFETATTTRKGVLFPEHVDHLHALPRVSLNGDYQTQRYVRLFLSGAPFALAQQFQRLNTN